KARMARFAPHDLLSVPKPTVASAQSGRLCLKEYVTAVAKICRTWSSSEQAYVSAEQPPPGEDSRVSPAHAHPGRAGDPRGEAPEGPRARQRLTLAVSGGGAMLPATGGMRRGLGFA